MFTEPASAREEAERLVAAILAAATLAANANPQISTGSAECCVCPLCKVIAAVRDPDPQTVERIATGAGDLAAGVASFLRHLGAGGTTAGNSGKPKDPWAAAEHSTHGSHADEDMRHATSEGLGAAAGSGSATRKSATGWPGDASSGDGAATRGGDGVAAAPGGEGAGKGAAGKVPGARKPPKKAAPKKAAAKPDAEPATKPAAAKVVKKAIRKKTES